MEEKKSLPLLPTGKEHVSYSEMVDWIECSWRHKVKHIDKIYTFSQSIHTEYGQTIHDAMEWYIMQPIDDRKSIEAEKYIEQFKELLKPVKEEQYAKVVASNHDEEEVKAYEAILKNEVDFIEVMPEIFRQAPAWLDETFPGWEPIYAEFEINEPFEGARFKGFIDAVIKVPSKRKTKTGKNYYYQCIDWKTTSWGWPAKVQQDFNKQLQLILYKIFFSEICGIDPNDVRCSFVLLKRSGGKSGVLCQEIKISSGEKNMEKARALLKNFISQIRKGLYHKTKWESTCRFCDYKYTEHCT